MEVRPISPHIFGSFTVISGAEIRNEEETNRESKRRVVGSFIFTLLEFLKDVNKNSYVSEKEEFLIFVMFCFTAFAFKVGKKNLNFFSNADIKIMEIVYLMLRKSFRQIIKKFKRFRNPTKSCVFVFFVLKYIFGVILY